MKAEDFIVHACEQVMRFTKTDNWDDLSEAVKVQLGFNMGVMALGLELAKEDGFLALANLRERKVSVIEFRKHIEGVIKANNINVDQKMIDRPF